MNTLIRCGLGHIIGEQKGSILIVYRAALVDGQQGDHFFTVSDYGDSVIRCSLCGDTVHMIPASLSVEVIDPVSNDGIDHAFVSLNQIFEDARKNSIADSIKRLEEKITNG